MSDASSRSLVPSALVTREGPWRHLIDQAARCIEHGDEVGAEVHLTAALESGKQDGDRGRVARALIELGRLRIRQRRRGAAERLLHEASALGAGAELDGEIAELLRARD